MDFATSSAGFAGATILGEASEGAVEAPSDPSDAAELGDDTSNE
jgi:hypothetical protein